ncbi:MULTISPECIES: hypothetical protein [Nostocales]|uniref:Uncharacterized protein n=2 Tax=Nostocales TaxID=1161 RepID=A0ABW8WJU4_9CYAN|nr:hypothetical protein [Tolypothrix bouteillei]
MAFQRFEHSDACGGLCQRNSPTESGVYRNRKHWQENSPTTPVP